MEINNLVKKHYWNIRFENGNTEKIEVMPFQKMTRAEAINKALDITNYGETFRDCITSVWYF